MTTHAQTARDGARHGGQGHEPQARKGGHWVGAGRCFFCKAPLAKHLRCSGCTALVGPEHPMEARDLVDRRCPSCRGVRPVRSEESYGGDWPQQVALVPVRRGMG